MGQMNFYEELNKKVGEYIRSLTSDHDQIAEVTQEALIKIHKSIDTLQDQDKLTSWLKRIVYTTLMDYHRRQQKRYSGKLEDTVSIEIQDNDGNEALTQCITTLLKALPDEQRELLEAVELNGISQTEYAISRNIPPSTVKSRVQRAKLKIKEQIMSSCFLKLDSYGNVVDYNLPKN
jgi:RNA polymerase sigma-70 factor, ECF subfamily